MKKESITMEEAKSFVDETAPRLGCGDFTYTPEFPKGSDDVCLVSRAVENGYSYGYSIVYLVWKSNREIKKRELADTRSTKDNLYWKNLRIEKNSLVFDLEVSGTYSGKSSVREVHVDLTGLQ